MENKIKCVFVVATFRRMIWDMSRETLGEAFWYFNGQEVLMIFLLNKLNFWSVWMWKSQNLLSNLSVKQVPCISPIIHSGSVKISTSYRVAPWGWICTGKKQQLGKLVLNKSVWVLNESSKWCYLLGKRSLKLIPIWKYQLYLGDKIVYYVIPLNTTS